jgi:betaine-homocysteine S-methyltransferase
MADRLHDHLSRGPLVVAEGFVFELERSCLLQAGAFVPTVVLEHPQAVRHLTDRFIDSGSDVVLALTYYTNADKLRRLGMEGRLEEINRAALQIAIDAAADATVRHGRPYLVAGNVCNTYEFEDYRDVDRYRRDVLPGIRQQVTWAREAGVDFMVGETYFCLDEARLHLGVIKEAGLPAVITLSARDDRTPEGLSFEEACRILWEEGADVVGLNCTRGPATMLPILERIRTAIPPHGHVAALPVPYRTDEKEPIFLRLDRGQAFPTGLDSHLCSRDTMAEFARRAHDMGIRYIGACCGTGPHHVRAMAEALGRETPASRYSPDMSKHGALGRATDDAIRLAWKGNTERGTDAGTDGGTILGSMDELSPSAIARTYDDLAPTYATLVQRAGYVLPQVMAGHFRAVADRLGVSVDGAVIDAGCGNGLSGIALRDAGFTQVYGLDLSPGLIAQIPPGLYRSFEGEGVIEASLTDLPQHYWGQFDHVFSAGTIGHTATLDLDGIVKLARKGGLVAFSVRENRLGRYDVALAALRSSGLWTPQEQFRVEDAHKETSPHIVLIERVTGDALARFSEIERFFYRLPSSH